MKQLVRGLDKFLLVGTLLGSLACSGEVAPDFTARDAKALDPCEDDAFEPNQSAVQAVNLPFGGSLEAVSCPQNVDFYEFEGPAAGTPFTVSMLFVSDDFDYGTDTGDLNALLRDPAGNLLFIGDRVAKDNEFLPAVSSGGVYSLEVQSALRRVPYTLAVTQGSLRCGILEDAFEPNDDSSQATPIADLGSVTSGYICRGDSDFYRVQGPPAGQTLRIDFPHDTARGDLNLRVWDQDGQSVGSIISNTASLVPSDGRLYFVEVVGSGKASGDYQLTFASQAATCELGHDTFEPNDRAEDATPLTLPTTIDATMCGGNNDFFRFRGPGIGLPFDVNFEIPNGPVSVEVRDAATERVEARQQYFYGGTIRLVSRGGDYVVRVSNPSAYGLLSVAYRLTLAEPVGGARRCDLDRDLGSLPTACGAANAGPIHGLNLAQDPPPEMATGNSYVLKLVPELDPLTGWFQNRGQAFFTPTANGTYGLFTGTPGASLAVSAGGVPVPATCSLSVSERTCNKLLRGDRYEFVAGIRYTIDIGPIQAFSETPRSVRLGIEATTPDDSPRACSLHELRALETTCQDAALGGTPIQAGALEASGAPAVEAQQIYGVRLNTTGTGNSGALTFTPTVSGEYVVYKSIPKLPFSVRDESTTLTPRCQGALTAEVCEDLRFAAAYSLEGGRTYRFEFGPTSPQTYVRFTIQPNVSYVGECNLDELESLTRACPSATWPDLVVDANPGFGGQSTTIGYLPLSAANVRLAEIEGGFGGSVRMYSNSFRTAVFFGSAAVPVRAFGPGRRSVDPLCVARVPSATCDVLKVAHVYPTNYRQLDLEFGPSDRRFMRVAWGPEEDPPPPAPAP